MRYWPPTKPSGPSSASNSRSRARAASAVEVRMRAVRGFAISVYRVDFVSEIVDPLEFPVEPLQRIRLALELHLHLLGQDEQAAQVGQLGVLGPHQGDFLLESDQG